MRKIYRKLTKEQRARGVIFTSTLSKHTLEQPGDFTHEVKSDMPDKYERIERLKDDAFFNASPWTYNIIRN